MSGCIFNGTYVGREITAYAAMLDTPMSEYQRRSVKRSYNIIDVKDVKEFNKNKVMSKERFLELVEKYRNELERWHWENDKYALYAYRLGVSHFGKFKPEYKKLEKTYYRAKKDEENVGFVYGDIDCSVLFRGYKTEASARKAAMKYLKEHPNKDVLYVFKAYQDKISTCISKAIPVTKVYLSEIGQMKSMPKKQPKSYVVVPVYYYIWDATVTDPEYEWM